jgi:putative FmdB family regulatory protein
MPVYLFSCERCGPFDVWRSASEASHGSQCPICRRPGRRIFTPPGIARTPAPVRKAREREEKSAHEPDVLSQPRGRPLPWHEHKGPQPPWVLGH